MVRRQQNTAIGQFVLGPVREFVLGFVLQERASLQIIQVRFKPDMSQRHHHAALTVGGTGNTKLLNGELTFRRPIEQIWGANNSQDPNQFAAGPLEVTGRVNVYMDDDTDLARFTGGTKPATALTFTSGTNVLTITMSTCDWEAVTIDRSGVYVRSDFNLRGLHNTTDGGPVKVTVANSVANYNYATSPGVRRMPRRMVLPMRTATPKETPRIWRSLPRLPAPRCTSG
jgi:hypothetical protein